MDSVPLATGEGNDRGKEVKDKPNAEDGWEDESEVHAPMPPARLSQSSIRRFLLQHRVLRLGFLQDRAVGVGVFPERAAATKGRQTAGGKTGDRLDFRTLADKIQARL
jgi:hypothetical protein